MPWETVWVPPKDLKKIKVIPGSEKEIPPGFAPYFLCMGSGSVLRSADEGKPDEEAEFLHFCPSCMGWVEGKPDMLREDTSGPLCGRKGTSTSCRRCGRKIGFFGSVS